MKPKRSNDKDWLMETAETIAQELRIRSEGTCLRIRKPRKAWPTETDGWSVKIANLGKGRPDLEIWLDRFTGYPDRKLCACFYSLKPKPIRSLTSNVSKSLWPVRKLKQADLIFSTYFKIKHGLKRSEFSLPVLEDYPHKKEHFYSIYAAGNAYSPSVNRSFCNNAVAFFLDVAHSLPDAKPEDYEHAAFPRCEDRKWVAAHLGRERSRYLASQCKQRDHYCCQVCKMTFTKEYGQELGEGFAEAHHIRPLGQTSANVKTRLEDLITVCANCHRMLHRMDGKGGDIAKLRNIVAKQRRKGA